MCVYVCKLTRTTVQTAQRERDKVPKLLKPNCSKWACPRWRIYYWCFVFFFLFFLDIPSSNTSKTGQGHRAVRKEWETVAPGRVTLAFYLFLLFLFSRVTLFTWLISGSPSQEFCSWDGAEQLAELWNWISSDSRRVPVACRSQGEPGGRSENIYESSCCINTDSGRFLWSSVVWDVISA